MDETIQGTLNTRAETAPDRRAIGFVDADGAAAWTSWGELRQRAGGVARRLREEGLGAGDACVLVLPSDETSAYLLVGTLLAGGVPLLVAPPPLLGGDASLVRTLRHCVRTARPRLVVSTRALLESGRVALGGPGGPRVLSADACVPAGDAPAAPVVAPAPDSVALLQLTSGTTGRPRICVWTQAAVLAAVRGMAAAMQLTPDDSCVNWTPLYHDMGLVNNLLLCLTHGVPLAMFEPHDFVKRPALWLRALSRTGATLSWAPNFGFALAARRVSDAELEGVRLDHVRGLWNAAERIHATTMEAFRARFAPFGLRGAALRTNYGLAENIGGATFSDPSGVRVESVQREPLQARRVARLAAPGDPHAIQVVGVGRPCPGVRVTIVSPAGRPVPDGHVGEIVLETPSRMAGYLGDARATRRALRGGRLRTGDLGYTREDQLFWVGRVRERVVVRGKKLDPSDFEAALFGIAGLRDGCFAVFGVDDERHGTQRIVLVSEIRPDSSRAPVAIGGEIRDRVHGQLGVELGEVVLVRQGTLTKTSSGKRRHRHARELYLAGALEPARVAGAG
jgi:acyl-CoA synthetase (AMP-forming)/AMP-acid ligase II